jgi:CheY-like chemotaxis protein
VFPTTGPATVRKKTSSVPTPVPLALRVLVVDDGPSVGKALRRMLSRHHPVVATTGAREALELLRQGERFDAILCDLMMPEMSGMELYRVLQEQLPAMARRVVFMTGGTFTDAARPFIARVPNPTMDKPFDRDHLQEVLSKVTGP